MDTQASTVGSALAADLRPVVNCVRRSAARADPTCRWRARNKQSRTARYFFTFFFPSPGMHLWKKSLKSGWLREGKVLLRPGMGVGCFQKGLKPMFLSGRNCPFFGKKRSFILALHQASLPYRYGSLVPESFFLFTMMMEHVLNSQPAMGKRSTREREIRAPLVPIRLPPAYSIVRLRSITTRLLVLSSNLLFV